MVKNLDDIPADWHKSKVKYVAELMPKCDMYGVKGNTIVGYAPMECIKNGFFIRKSEEYEKIPPSLSPYQSGDIVMAKVTPCFENGNIAIMTDVPSGIGFGSSELFVIRAKKITTKFLFYWLQNLDFVHMATSSMTGMGGLKRVQSSVISNAVITMPPEEEQYRITNFLDAKCIEIDSVVADIQAQIDTLEQYKRSVITEAVTKGLNPDAEMRDSGHEWVGKIPVSWKMQKGKFLFAQRNMRGNSKELQLLSPTQKFGVIPQDKYEELTGMSPVKLNEKTDLSLLKTIHRGDFCISLRSFQGGFEYSEYEGVTSPAYQVFYPQVKIEDGYYRYLFKEDGFIEKMNSYTMNLRDGKNIAFADFGNSYIPYPPLNEQAAISAYLDNRCAEIDSTIIAKRQQLETLADYKKSLIFEYVTGKKEVPAS